MDLTYTQQRVRARKNVSDSDSITSSISDTNAIDDIGSQSDNSQIGAGSNDSDGDSEEAEGSHSDNSEPRPDDETASISFGALAKAQDALGKRKRSSGDSEDDGQKFTRRSKLNATTLDSETLERKAGKKDTRSFTRASKHAPAELSSKKAVSRKREVVPTQKISYRDPRFEPVSGPLDEQKLKKHYSFLKEYRDTEISDLKSAIRKTKDPDAREKLKRALLSMESRKKSQQMKEQEQEILRQHRKEEKAKIQQGKKPFYLKKADQKQLALVKRFEGMNGKQVNKVIERRRKKHAGKERKAMLHVRRQ